MSMWDKLNEVEARFEEVSELLSSPKVLGDRNLFHQYSKEHNDLTAIVATYRAYKKAKEEYQESKQLSQSNDKEIAEMAREEALLLERELLGLEEELKLLLVPKDPNDSKNVILEIRAGAGGATSPNAASARRWPRRGTPAQRGRLGRWSASVCFPKGLSSGEGGGYPFWIGICLARGRGVDKGQQAPPRVGRVGGEFGGLAVEEAVRRAGVGRQGVLDSRPV